MEESLVWPWCLCLVYTHKRDRIGRGWIPEPSLLLELPRSLPVFQD